MRNRRLLLGAGFIGVLAVVAVLLREHTSIEALVQRETQLRDAIVAHPVESWLIGFGVYFLASLVPLTGGKSVVFGWLFGFLPAIVMVDGALTLAAIVTFLSCRYLIRDAVEARFAVHVERLNHHLERDGPFYLLFLRMAHAPYTFINYVSGALWCRRERSRGQRCSACCPARRCLPLPVLACQRCENSPIRTNASAGSLADRSPRADGTAASADSQSAALAEGHPASRRW